MPGRKARKSTSVKLSPALLTRVRKSVQHAGRGWVWQRVMKLAVRSLECSSGDRQIADLPSNRSALKQRHFAGCECNGNVYRFAAEGSLTAEGSLMANTCQCQMTAPVPGVFGPAQFAAAGFQLMHQVLPGCANCACCGQDHGLIRRGERLDRIESNFYWGSLPGDVMKAVAQTIYLSAGRSADEFQGYVPVFGRHPAQSLRLRVCYRIDRVRQCIPSESIWLQRVEKTMGCDLIHLLYTDTAAVPAGAASRCLCARASS